jgi:predicted TIM-barrel fold metal-dependent hydrolase
MDRRRFLGMTIASGFYTSCRQIQHERKHPALDIIDAHQHLWHIRKDRPAWLSAKTGITEAGNMNDYLKAIQGLGITKAIYMEVAIETARLDEEARYVIQLCERRDSPTMAAVIGGRPTEDSFKRYLKPYQDSPYVKGVRYIMNSAEQLANPVLHQNLQWLGRLDLSFDLNVPPALLAYGVRLTDACPDTRFIIDHCGNADPVAFLPAGAQRPRAARHDADQWKKDMKALSQRKNVCCKISGLVDEVPGGGWTLESLAAIVNFCLDIFGEERVVFASDWPVCLAGATLKMWLDTLWDIVGQRPLAELKKLFSDNAARWYRLNL